MRESEIVSFFIGAKIRKNIDISKSFRIFFAIIPLFFSVLYHSCSALSLLCFFCRPTLDIMSEPGGNYDLMKVLHVTEHTLC